MNATNRVVNRFLLFVIGTVLVAAGGAAVMASVWPVAAEIWRAAASTAVDWMMEADRNSRLSDATTVSWLTLGVLAVLVVIIVLVVSVIARLGGGRTSAVIRVEAESEPQAPVTIRHGFAADAIAGSLDGHEEILASRVNARRVGGVDVLHVSVTPRQNTSPMDVASTVTRLVDNLATLTGRETPTYVSIHSGVRSRLAADQSRVN